jgi:hypothetical protein
MSSLNGKLVVKTALDGPSGTGVQRYAETNGYYRLHESDNNRYPCQCKPTCPGLCNGACGCFACRVATVDDRSIGIHRSETLPVAERKAR